MTNLHVDSITKSYDLKTIISDVYMSINQGDIVGLLGRNGSGKSTLLKIIFGSLKAENKFVRVDGQVIRNLRDGRKLINYLPQHNFLPENIKVGTIINTFCKNGVSKILLNKDSIKNNLDKKNNQLSGGERRIIEIYLILYSEANFILLDEPFNGVAPIYKEDIKQAIKEESVNKGIIITDHDYRNVLDISTRLIIIRDACTKELEDRSQLIEYGYLPTGGL